MQSSILYTIFAALSLFQVVLSSAITTYKDAQCTKSFSNLDAVNGYPDGVCTPIDYRSFVATQIAQLDDGCAVTLYGPNEGPLACSSSVKIVADFATCYNSSWAYYSIDGCVLRNSSSSSIILPPATSTPTPKAASSSSIAAPLLTSATATATPYTAPKPNNTGAIVGGVVGGVAVLALVFGLILFYLRPHRPKDAQLPPSYELSNERALLEASNDRAVLEATNSEVALPEKVVHNEMWGHDAAAEIGRNSLYIPPAELPGDSTVGEDKKGINPLIKVHMVR